MPDEIKIFQLNIQSLQKNKDELARVLIKDEYNVALISESWSKRELEGSKYRVPGFFTFLDSRDDGYGGAGILVDKQLKSKEITLPKFSKIQSVARLIVAYNIVVMSIYVAPNFPLHTDTRGRIFISSCKRTPQNTCRWGL